MVIVSFFISSIAQMETGWLHGMHTLVVFDLFYYTH